MRWIRNIFALIAFAFLVLWVSSHFYIIGGGTPLKKGSGLSFSSCSGHASVGVSHGGTPNYPSDEWRIELRSLKTLRENIQMMHDVGIDMKSPEELLTYGYKTFNLSDPGGRWTWSGADFAFPLWLPTLLFGLWPGIALTRHINRRYFTRGICRGCGYDLRGTPSGVCPECGHGASATTR